MVERDNPELLALIKKMRSYDRQTMLAAVEELRRRGWLTDGSLVEADLTLADLSVTNLTGAVLREANLRGVKLIEADLTGADMTRVDLLESDLTGCNLTRAGLKGADMTRVDLTKADLTGADLTGVDLTEAELFNSEFTNVTCGQSEFTDVDLSSVKGLETVVHDWSSAISINTLYWSQGKIPISFLRGCGVPEILIEYLPALTANPIDFYSCFISYSHADKSFARRLHDTLQGRGIRCWLDEHAILPGDKIHKAVYEGIRVWDKVLLCCSEESLNSWWVDSELNMALEKERNLTKQRGEETLVIIPLDLDGYFQKHEDGWANQIRQRYAEPFNGWEGDNAIFERGVERVIKALRTESGRLQPPPKL